MYQRIPKKHQPGKGAKQDKHRRHQAKCAAFKAANLRERHKLFHLRKHIGRSPNDLVAAAALKMLTDNFVKGPLHRGLGLGHLGQRY